MKIKEKECRERSVGVDYWRPMLDFLRTSMVQQGTIDQADIDRILVTDDVATAVAHVKQGAQKHLGKGMQPQRKPSVLLGESTPKRG